MSPSSSQIGGKTELKDFLKYFFEKQSYSDEGKREKVKKKIRSIFHKLEDSQEKSGSC